MKQNQKASEMTQKELAAYIDHSVLKPEFTWKEIKENIQGGIDYGCKTVCVNPVALKLANEMTKGTETKVCVVCDFPFGVSTTESKVLQAETCCKEGVYELDIVANYGWIRSGMWNEVEEELRQVIYTCHQYGTAVKVIFETDALEKEQIVKATEVAINAGTDFIKTSTGFYSGGENVGATIEVIALMMKAANGRCKVKGSGCIRSKEHFCQLIDMGIDRMGVGYKSTPIVLSDRA